VIRTAKGNNDTQQKNDQTRRGCGGIIGDRAWCDRRISKWSERKSCITGITFRAFIRLLAPEPFFEVALRENAESAHDF
jgi:hypothetical protein